MDKIQIKNYFNGIASTADEWKKRNKYYHQEVGKLIKFLVRKDASVLEVGCGTGDILAGLEINRGKGIDISQEMIARARQKYQNLDFEVMDVENLNLSEKYDYIILSDVIGFLFDIQGAISKLHKVCYQKSRLIITYYNYFWEPFLKLAEKLNLKIPQPWQNWVSSGDLENILYLAGFEVIKKGERLLLPKYIPIISGLINRYLARLPIIKEACLVYYVIARPMPEIPNSFFPKVSIIIPARNEAGNIDSAVQRIPNLGSHTEIIFVEGHSQDNTLEKIKEAQKKYAHKDIKFFVQEGKGKGDAVRKGFDSAQGEILMILDADLSVQPEDLTKFYEAIVSGRGEFINGCRLVYPMEKQAMRFLNLIANKFFSIMFSWLLGQRIKDTLCGTKVLWKEDYEKIKKGRNYFGNFDPFGDFDLLFGAAKLNLKIIDLPIRYLERTYGKTNINRFRHGWLLFKMVIFAMKKIKFI